MSSSYQLILCSMSGEPRQPRCDLIILIKNEVSMGIRFCREIRLHDAAYERVLVLATSDITLSTLIRAKITARCLGDGVQEFKD